MTEKSSKIYLKQISERESIPFVRNTSSIERFMDYYSYVNGTCQINNGYANLTKNACIERGIWRMGSSHGMNPLHALLNDGALRYESNLVTYSTEYMYDIISANFTCKRRKSSIAIVLGQMTTNISHFIRDCFWLYGVMNAIESKFGKINFYIIKY